MGIKHRIKFKNIDRDRGTSPAELRSSGPKQRPDEGSDDARRVEVERSDSKGIHPNDMDFVDHLKKFFKGKNEVE